MDRPLYSSETPATSRVDRFYRGIAGAFSINRRRTNASQFNINYRPERDLPKKLDRPLDRFGRFLGEIVNGAPGEFEYYTMKVPYASVRRRIEAGTMKRFYPGKFSAGAPAPEFIMPIWSKSRITGRAMHLGWVPFSGGPEGGEGLLPGVLRATQGVEPGVTMPLKLYGDRVDSWWFGQRKLAGEFTVFSPNYRKPAQTLRSGKATHFSRFSMAELRPAVHKAFNTDWWLGNAGKIAAVGAVAAAGIYALNAYGKPINESRWDGQNEGPWSSAIRHSLTDFGSARRPGNPVTNRVAGAIVHEALEKIPINSKVFTTVEKRLGGGRYGDTYTIKGHPFLVKIPRPIDWEREKDIYGRTYSGIKALENTPFQEAAALKDLTNVTGIPRFYGFDPDSQRIFMERASGTSGTDFRYLDKEHKKTGARQLLATFLRMAKKGYLHGDVHTGNVLYDKDNKLINLVDFGHSRKYEAFDTLSANSFIHQTELGTNLDSVDIKDFVNMERLDKTTRRLAKRLGTAFNPLPQQSRWSGFSKGSVARANREFHTGWSSPFNFEKALSIAKKAVSKYIAKQHHYNPVVASILPDLLAQYEGGALVKDLSAVYGISKSNLSNYIKKLGYTQHRVRQGFVKPVDFVPKPDFAPLKKYAEEAGIRQWAFNKSNPVPLLKAQPGSTEFSELVDEIQSLRKSKVPAAAIAKKLGTSRQQIHIWVKQAAEAAANKMARGEAGLGKPLNEIVILDKPRHGDFRHGSWLSGAWKDFRAISSATSLRGALEGIGAKSSHRPDLFMDASKLAHTKYPIFYNPSILENAAGEIPQHLMRIAYSDPRAAPLVREELRKRALVGAVNPIHVFHEMEEAVQARIKMASGRPFLRYGVQGTGGHAGLGVIKGELRAAEVYDYLHGTGYLSATLAFRRSELSGLSNSLQHYGTNSPILKTTRRYIKNAGKMLDLYERGGYSFISEIDKGHGNIREFFPEDWLDKVGPGLGAWKEKRGIKLGNINGWAEDEITSIKQRMSTLDYGQPMSMPNSGTKTAVKVEEDLLGDKFNLYTRRETTSGYLRKLARLRALKQQLATTDRRFAAKVKGWKKAFPAPPVDKNGVIRLPSTGNWVSETLAGAYSNPSIGQRGFAAAYKHQVAKILGKPIRNPIRDTQRFASLTGLAHHYRYPTPYDPRDSLSRYKAKVAAVLGGTYKALHKYRFQEVMPSITLPGIKKSSINKLLELSSISKASYNNVRRKKALRPLQERLAKIHAWQYSKSIRKGASAIEIEPSITEQDLSGARIISGIKPGIISKFRSISDNWMVKERYADLVEARFSIQTKEWLARNKHKILKWRRHADESVIKSFIPSRSGLAHEQRAQAAAREEYRIVTQDRFENSWRGAEAYAGDPRRKRAADRLLKKQLAEEAAARQRSEQNGGFGFLESDYESQGGQHLDEGDQFEGSSDGLRPDDYGPDDEYYSPNSPPPPSNYRPYNPDNNDANDDLPFRAYHKKYSSISDIIKKKLTDFGSPRRKIAQLSKNIPRVLLANSKKKGIRSQAMRYNYLGNCGAKPIVVRAHKNRTRGGV